MTIKIKNQLSNAEKKELEQRRKEEKELDKVFSMINAAAAIILSDKRDWSIISSTGDVLECAKLTYLSKFPNSLPSRVFDF